MTAAAPIPAAEAPPMAHTSDSRPDQPAAEAPPAAAEATAPVGTEPRRWAFLGDHPLLAVLGTLLALVGTALFSLLIFVLNDHGDRIDALDAKIDVLDAKIDVLDLKLTALIAGLNKTDEVDAAMEGRLLDSEPGAPG